MSEDLRTKVRDALDIAINENKYVELLTAPPSRVAVDLTSYDAGLEGAPINVVTRYVDEYQKDKQR